MVTIKEYYSKQYYYYLKVFLNNNNHKEFPGICIYEDNNNIYNLEYRDDINKLVLFNNYNVSGFTAVLDDIFEDNKFLEEQNIILPPQLIEDFGNVLVICKLNDFKMGTLWNIFKKRF